MLIQCVFSQNFILFIFFILILLYCADGIPVFKKFLKLKTKTQQQINKQDKTKFLKIGNFPKNTNSTTQFGIIFRIHCGRAAYSGT